MLILQKIKPLILSFKRAIMSQVAQDISAMRKPYKSEHESFKEDDLVSGEPFANFTNWFELARAAESILEPNAMALGTATKDGLPSVRMVLLKSFDTNGFCFFTNYSSRKGQELEANPRATMMFYWESLMKSIRVEGKVEKIPEEDSVAYFRQRPRSSQIGAAISHQSSVVPSRKFLMDKQAELEVKYEGQEVPKPEPWGGYLLRPDAVEFWQGQTTRVHDRIRFRRPSPGETLDPEVTRQGEDGWVYERLSP